MVLPILGSLAMGAGSALASKLFNPSKPYRAAQDEMRRGYEEGQGYYDSALGYQQPYVDRGNEMYGYLSPAIKALLDPAALESKWSEGYTESPEAQQARELAKQSGVDAASALGLSGSTPALMAMQEGTNRITMNDRQNYLDRLMQKYLSGISGARDIYDRGYGASGRMSDIASNMGRNAIDFGNRSSEMEYAREAAPGQMYSKLFGQGIGLGMQNKNVQDFMNNMGWSTTGG